MAVPSSSFNLASIVILPQKNTSRAKVALVQSTATVVWSLGGVFDGFRRLSQPVLHLRTLNLFFFRFFSLGLNCNQSETRLRWMISISSYHSVMMQSHVRRHGAKRLSYTLACYDWLRYAFAGKERWAIMISVYFWEPLVSEKRCCWNVYKISFVAIVIKILKSIQYCKQKRWCSLTS